MSHYNNKNENENDNTVTVKEFNIPEDKFDAVHEILSSKTSWYNKKDRLLAPLLRLWSNQFAIISS